MVQDDVGLNAINDLIYLQSTTYRLLRKYFRHLPYYTDLLDLFHDVCNFYCHYIITVITCVKEVMFVAFCLLYEFLSSVSGITQQVAVKFYNLAERRISTRTRNTLHCIKFWEDVDSLQIKAWFFLTL